MTTIYVSGVNARNTELTALTIFEGYVDSYHTEECELNTLMDGLDELELMYAHIKVAKRRIQWINDIVEDEGS